MAFFINWLNAIGALVIFGLIYNNGPLLNPMQAGFMSLMALVFLALSYMMRVNSMKMIKLKHWQSLLGIILVLVVIGASIYFAVPQIQEFTSTGQYAVIAWMFVLDAMILVESLLTFKNSKHPLLERRVQRLEQQEAAQQKG